MRSACKRLPNSKGTDSVSFLRKQAFAIWSAVLEYIARSHEDAAEDDVSATCVEPRLSG